jgi:hypothetical protein
MPRAPPVTNATRPSCRPGICSPSDANRTDENPLAENAYGGQTLNGQWLDMWRKSMSVASIVKS